MAQRFVRVLQCDFSGIIEIIKFFNIIGKNPVSRYILQIWFLAVLGAALLATTPHTGEAVAQPYEGRIFGIAWNPTGSMLVISGTGGIAIYGNDATFLAFVTPDFYDDVAWSPDGSHIAGITLTATSAALISVWDVQDLQNIQLVNSIDDARGRLMENALYIDYMLSSDEVVVNGTNVVIWDTDTGTTIASLENGVMNQDVRYSPDGSLVAVASLDRVSIWDFASGVIQTDVAQEATHLSVAWNTDGTLIATDNGYNIEIWDIQTNQLIQTLVGHSDNIISLDWRNNFLASSSAGVSDGTIRIWNTDTGKLVEIIDEGNVALSIAWSPDGNQLAYPGPDGAVRVIQTP